MAKPGQSLEEIKIEFTESNNDFSMQNNLPSSSAKSPKKLQEEELTKLRSRLSEIAVQIHVLETKAYESKSPNPKVEGKLEHIRTEYFKVKTELDSVSPPKPARRQLRP